VQAQTVANAFLAMDAGLTIIPVLNKIDLPHARPEFVIGEMEQALMIDPDERDARQRQDRRSASRTCSRPSSSASRRPPGDPDAPLKALIYNSHFDTYKGVVVYIRMMDGGIKLGQKIKLMRTGVSTRSPRSASSAPR
jgi:GTP-binding protein LepA